MSYNPQTLTCPACGRTVTAASNRFRKHSMTAGSQATCFMSEQRVPIFSDDLRGREAQAHLVADLAVRLRDEDPRNVWNYLTAVDEKTMQQLLMTALAAIPVEGKTVADLWDWVYGLAVAS